MGSPSNVFQPPASSGCRARGVPLERCSPTPSILRHALDGERSRGVPSFNNAFPLSASSGCAGQGAGQWDPPLVMFSSPQHTWGALDGEQANGILLLIMLSNHQHPQGAPDGWQGNEVTPLVMLSNLPASPLPFFS